MEKRKKRFESALSAIENYLMLTNLSPEKVNEYKECMILVLENLVLEEEVLNED